MPRPAQAFLCLIFHFVSSLTLGLNANAAPQFLEPSPSVYSPTPFKVDLPFHYAVPHVPASDRGWQVEVILTNPGQSLSEFVVSIHETQPEPTIVQETSPRILLPKSAQSLSDLLSQEGGDRWFSIHASTPIAGTVTIGRQGALQAERAQYPLIPISSDATRLLFPHVPADRDQFWAGMALVNHGESTELSVSLWGERGQDLSHLLNSGFREVTLQSGAKLVSLFADRIFDDRDSSEKVSWISIEADQPLSGIALFGLKQGSQLGDLAGLTALTPEQLSDQAWTPVSLDRAEYQAMVLLNPDDRPLTLTAQLWNREGRSMGNHQFTLGPKQKLLSLASATGLNLPFGPLTPALTLNDQEILELGSLAINGDGPFLMYQLEGTPGHLIGGHRVHSPKQTWAAATVKTASKAILHLRSTLDGDRPHEVTVTAQTPSGNRAFSQVVTLAPRSALDLTLPALPAHSYLLCQDSQTEPGLSVWLTEGDELQRDSLSIGHAHLPPPELPSVESLRVESKSEIPTVSGPEAAWMLANSHPLQSITADHFDDLHFLQRYIGDRRLVQLGESSHGAREFNQAKVRLIKYLHQEMGFDVIAFESGLFECDWVGKNFQLFTPEGAMASSIFAVWSTQEVKALFEYILATQRSQRPLRLTGFDVQVSSSIGARRRPNYLFQFIQPLNQVLATSLRNLDRQITSNGINEAWFIANRQALNDTYGEALRSLEAERTRLQILLPAALASEIPLVIQILEGQMLEFDRLAERFIQNDPLRAFELRDEGMANAISFLAEEAYPDRKIMIWAHNSHIRHNGPNAQQPLFGNIREMGYWLQQRHREELYTIGLYMVQGASADNRRISQPVLPPRTARSIEALFHSTRHAYGFLDMLHQEATNDNAWLFEAPGTEHWYWGRSGPEIFIPRQNFDAVLVIDTTSVPSYL